jgi:hypothetical protein
VELVSIFDLDATSILEVSVSAMAGQYIVAVFGSATFNLSCTRSPILMDEESRLSTAFCARESVKTTETISVNNNTKMCLKFMFIVILIAAFRVK